MALDWPVLAQDDIHPTLPCLDLSHISLFPPTLCLFRFPVLLSSFSFSLSCSSISRCRKGFAPPTPRSHIIRASDPVSSSPARTTVFHLSHRPSAKCRSLALPTASFQLLSTSDRRNCCGKGASPLTMPKALRAPDPENARRAPQAQGPRSCPGP